ncbi:hypothetical protein [Flavobacterium azizsancarii]|nr:hypothetical protein [Flavobacterium azizsancarii]
MLSLLLLFGSMSYGQESKMVTGYFDNDTVIDTLYYKFNIDSANGPIYQCTMIRSDKKEKLSFDIGVAFKSFQVSNCGKGCIETYQWKTGMDGFEEYKTYKYCKEYDNWILKKERTLDADGKEKTTTHKKTITGIDGREYKK